MMPIKNTILLACSISICSAATLAQEVELYLSDGSLSVRGELVDFVNQKYIIDTSVGRMTFDTNTILCKGEACPAIKPPLSEFNIVSMGIQASKIIPELLPAYAQSLDAQINRTEGGIYVLTDTADEEIARLSLSEASASNNLSTLLQQQAAIAITSQPVLPTDASASNTDPQTSQASSAGSVIGLNALTILTNQDNPVNAISTSDIAKVFSGEITNWSELDGPDAQISLYGPQPDSETEKLFEALIFTAQDDNNTQWSKEIENVENVAERVSSNPNAIGYSYFSNSQTAKSLEVQGVCGMATPANSFTIKAEEYPLTQRFYAHQSPLTNVEHIDTLLGFMQSDAGQDIVSSHGLINQRETSDSINNQGVRFVHAIASNATDKQSELLRTLVTQIIDSKRLSTTFRFKTGSNQFDQRAQTDISRLARLLQSPDNRNRKVHLLGFTDSVGDFDLNREVSLRRANQIRDALIEFDTTLAEHVNMIPAGFGEIAPLACNENAQGRLVNRRVEVWIN